MNVEEVYQLPHQWYKGPRHRQSANMTLSAANNAQGSASTANDVARMACAVLAQPATLPADLTHMVGAPRAARTAAPPQRRPRHDRHLYPGQAGLRRFPTILAHMAGTILAQPAARVSIDLSNICASIRSMQMRPMTRQPIIRHRIQQQDFSRVLLVRLGSKTVACRYIKTKQVFPLSYLHNVTGIQSRLSL